MSRFDILIRGGLIFDGTGADPVVADIGVRGDRIEDVGELGNASADLEVRAEGLCVCPGFIDVHSHSDAYLLVEPDAPSKIFQGITTEIVGQCGTSAAPLAGDYRLPADWRAHLGDIAWRSVAGYRAALATAGPAPNVRMFVGHNTLRGGVVGYERRRATPREIERMCALLRQSMEEGAAGFSTGLIYPPGCFAEVEEIHALAATAAEFGGVYSSHMRSEGSRLLEALDETITVARSTGIRVEVSHLKASGSANRHLAEPALEKIAAARAAGLEVAADRYPYTAACTDLDVVLPDWVQEGGPEEELRRLRDGRLRRRIEDELRRAHEEAYWDEVRIGTTVLEEHRGLRGRRLSDVGREMGLHPAAALLEIIAKEELRTAGIFFGMDEENMWRILAAPFVMVCTDASLRSPEGPLGLDHPHPRAYGAFPRFLRAAFDGRTVSPAEAIRKMTSLPAQWFRIADRGVIRAGAFADIVVFAPDELRDEATYERPHRLSRGIHWLLVNGTVTIAAGRLSGQRAGRWL